MNVQHTQNAQTGLRLPLVSGIVIATMVAISALSYAVLISYFLRSEAEITPQRAAFFAASMDEALTRIEHLPHVLSIDPNTLNALVTGETDALNPILEDIATRARAEFIYLLDINGQTIASSNYQDADSLVGNHYTFRPYFRDAVAGEDGRFYAVGVTTGRPGYFIAEPVRDVDGTIFGVVAVKIGIADLSRVLTDSGELVLVTDPQGVVLASSDPALIYGLTSPLSAFDRRVLEDQQQFGDQDLFALDWSPESATRARLNGTPYIWTKASLSQEEWTLHLLSDVGDIRRQSLLYVAIGVTSLLLLVVAAATYRAAQLRMALANSDADRRRLTAEIEERKLAEQKLSTARVELARKNQLAALGQLSASITHELGQPISAMRNYLVAEEIATDATPGSLWPELTGLVDRMQRILDQLRLFGRSRGAPPELFNLQDTLRSALQLVRHTADEARVALITDLPEAPCMLTGEPDRFEQVIVNLLRNGIDAARGAEGPQIKITLSEDAEFIVLSVSDNGVGFGDLEITDLREPFFSTKPSGQGMGLGLAISGQIVNEMGGSVSAQNNPKRGATFSVTIPKSDP